MPKYRISLSDGRTFEVEASAPPSEADVMAALGPSLTDPNRKPVSAEDFTEQKPGRGVGGFVSDLAQTLNPMPTLQAVTDLPRAMIGDPWAIKRMMDTSANVVNAQVAQVQKAKDAYGKGDYSAAASYGLAGATPLLGPAAAEAREKFESGDTAGGAGQTAGLIASVLAPKALPPVARAAGAGGRIMGRMRPAASVIAREVASDIPIVRGVLRGVKTLKDAKAATETANANAGGRLVRSTQPTIESDIAHVLEDVRAPEPAARITTPPPLDLPAGYQPRTSAPKPKLVKSSASPAAETPAVPRGRAYFLKPPKTAAAIEEPITPSGRPTTIADLPLAWRSRVNQSLVEPQGATGVHLASEAGGELSRRGLSPTDAMDAVSRNPRLTNDVRLRLRDALLSMLNQ